MHKIVTHNSKFHADDVFAVAALFLLLGEEHCEVARTRDPEAFTTGDYVVDVGGEYDADRNRFDHHQHGGAGERGNGIPYASFGLVWKKFGAEICRSDEIAETIDRALVQTIDAGDNGHTIVKLLIDDVMPYTISDLVDLFRATWDEEKNWDECFAEAIRWARWVLEREIKITKDIAEKAAIVRSVYENTPDKRLIVFDKSQNSGRELPTDILMNYPEPLFSVLYFADQAKWYVIAIEKSKGSFELRKPLPAAWGGKSDGEFAVASGVPDAVFCHRNLFLCVAASKEGALKLAHMALEA